MPRRRIVAKRELMADPVYHSELLAHFINCLMFSGKKSVAERIVYGALSKLGSRHRLPEDSKEGGTSNSGSAVLDLFDKALANIRPTLEVRSRRVGGATYQIPVEVPPNRRTTLAIRWLIASAAARGEKTMALRLAAELHDALEGRGSAVKKREDAHKMAKANQAFAHFRWN